MQPTVPYKNFLEVLQQVQDKEKVDYAIRALQGFEEKILETLSVKKYFNLVFKVKGCGKLGNSVPKK
jgi:hypothetical protein